MPPMKSPSIVHDKSPSRNRTRGRSVSSASRLRSSTPKQDLAAGSEPRTNEVFQHLVLSIKGDRLAAGKPSQIDAMGFTVEAQADTVVYGALAGQTLTDTRLQQEVHGALLEHAGAYRLLDFLAGAGLEHDRFHTLQDAIDGKA